MCEGRVGPVHFITHAQAMSISLVSTWSITNDDNSAVQMGKHS